jgi:hypothetical protein
MHPSGLMHSEIVATIDARSAAIGAEHCASGITRSIFLGRSPDTAKAEDVRRFRLHLASSRACRQGRGCAALSAASGVEPCICSLSRARLNSP